MDVAAARVPRRPSAGRIGDALVAATCLAALGVEEAAGAGAWHVTCLVALVAVVALLRRRRSGGFRRVVEVGTAVVVTAQPTLHLAGEMAHGPSVGHGPAHLGLLGLHLVLAAAFFVGLVLADVLALTLAGAVARIVRLARDRRAAPPPGRPAGVPPTAPAVHRWSPWVGYAALRGPPRTPSLA